jgi:hypothetical protein
MKKKRKKRVPRTEKLIKSLGRGSGAKKSSRTLKTKSKKKKLEKITFGKYEEVEKIKDIQVELGHNDVDHVKRLENLINDEREIISVEKQIQKLKENFESKKAILRKKVLKLKNINIEEDKIKELKKSKTFKRRMNLNKDDIIKEIALLKPNLERNYLIKLKKLELVQIWFSLEVKGEKTQL